MDNNDLGRPGGLSSASPTAPVVAAVPVSIPDAACDHKFVYSGLRYADGAKARPGSGATNTYYGHAYYCERCMEPRIESVPGDRNSYQERLSGSAPAADAERSLLVPRYDGARGYGW